MTVLEKLNYEIRNIVPSDKDRIFSDWLKSYQKTSPICKYVSKETYFKEQKKLITNLLQSQCLVISDKKDSYIVAGFCCFSVLPGKTILHYIYVKNEFRKLGLGSELIKFLKICNEKSFVEASHFVLNREANKFLNKYSIKYNPYTLINNTNA